VSGPPQAAVIAEMLLDFEPLVAQVSPAMSAVFLMGGKTRDNGYEIGVNWLAIEPTGSVHGYWGNVPNHADPKKKCHTIAAASLKLAEILNAPPSQQELAAIGYHAIPTIHLIDELIPSLPIIRRIGIKKAWELNKSERPLIPFYLNQFMALRRTA
jgi:hypothetical protein